jgi:solute carrier family 25 S-adenosylmethionine transporter 26
MMTTVSYLTIALVGGVALSLLVPVEAFVVSPQKPLNCFQTKCIGQPIRSQFPATFALGMKDIRSKNDGVSGTTSKGSLESIDNNSYNKKDSSSLPAAVRNIVPTVMLLVALLTFSPNVEPAQAVLGAGGAVVSSPAVVKRITLEEWIKLPEKKQRQYEGGFLSCNYEGVIDTTTALDGRIKKISRPKTVCRSTNLIDDLLKEIEVLQESDPDRAELFQAAEQNLLARQRLVDRQNIEAQLGKQPELIYFSCAFLASGIATSIMHPLDTLKVRMMSGKGGFADDEGEDEENENSKNILATLNDLYDGLLPNLLKEAPASALYLGIYEVARLKLEQVSFLQDHVLLIYLLAGSIGEFVGSIVRSPAEAIKTRVQAGLFDVPGALKNVFLTEEGRKNTLYAWSAGVFRDVPHGAILIALFELSKALIVDSSFDIDVNTLLAEAVLGGFGGGLGAFLTTPSDMITTKIITSIEDGGEPLLPQETLAQVWNDEGLKGLFQGYAVCF